MNIKNEWTLSWSKYRRTKSKREWRFSDIEFMRPKISKKETLNLIGYVGTKTKEILNELIEKNLIARVGQGRSTYYKLSKS